MDTKSVDYLLTESANLYHDKISALTESVNLYRDKINVLADAWLDMGYRAFGIWGWKDELLACWPITVWEEMKNLKASNLTLRAPLKVDELVIGTLGVLDGLKTPVREARLDAEASLVSELLTMKTKFEEVATELITQAQFRAEINTAAKIQLQLLPQQLPQVAGLDIYAYSCPSEQVGGDFYDFSAYKDRPFVFAIGDVSGHGLPAALFMTMTRIVLHTAARTMPTVDPKSILIRANEDLYDDFMEAGMFVTAFTGCYDPASEQLVYANAGHSPIIYCPRGGPATLLEADAPVVGILPTSTYTDHALPFLPQDVLVAGTDGLNESFNRNGEMFGYERLLTTVERLAHLPSDQIGIQLLNTINQFTEGNQPSDDQTLIVIKGVAK